MASHKDKDYHKLRNADKYLEFSTASGDTYGNLYKEAAEARAKYNQLWSKYGFKSMVYDKRRRNCTRKSNQKDKQLIHQLDRSRSKRNVKKHLVDEEHTISAETALGKGYLILHN